MREIKFRAWDTSMSAWLNIERMSRTATWGTNKGPGITLALPTEERSLDGYSPKRMDLQQYTGLKDKNGVEIYEGDVVQYSYIPYDGNPAKYAPVFKTHVIQYSVQLSSGSYYDLVEGFAGFSLDPIYEEYPFEVIGNIYENPELLKAVA